MGPNFKVIFVKEKKIFVGFVNSARDPPKNRWALDQTRYPNNH